MLHDSLASYLVVSAAMLSLGIYGILLRRNLIGILISLELILNAATLNLLAFNRFSLHDKGSGQAFAIFVIALAAAEAAIALSLTLLLYRKTNSIDIEKANTLKG